MNNSKWVFWVVVILSVWVVAMTLIGVFASTMLKSLPTSPAGNAPGIENVVHDGHVFVVLCKTFGTQTASGITHHPDCPKCKPEGVER